MKLLKNKYLLPAAVCGALLGYSFSHIATDKILPQDMNEATPAQIKTYDFIASLSGMPTYFRQTASGNYLAAQHAQKLKDWHKADDFLSKVLKEEPDNLELQKHAMVLAMASGDKNQAVDIASKIIDLEDENLLAVMFMAMEKFSAQDYEGAISVLDNLKEQNAATFLIPVLKLWAQAGLNKTNIYTLPPSSFYAHHALLIHHFIQPNQDLKDYAIKAYRAEDSDVREIEKFADLLVVNGEADKAILLYQAIEVSGFGDSDLNQKIEGLKNKEDINEFLTLPTIQNAKDGAALVFHDMANILVREKSDDSAIIFARMSLALNPLLTENHIIIGETFTRHERYEEAIFAYHQVSSNDKNYQTAQRQIADILHLQEKNDDAIKILTGLYEDYQNIEALIQISDIYRYEEKYEQAIEAYDQVLSKWDKTPEDYWFVLYARGMAYERLKDFKNSEVDLLAALSFRPDHPYVLNYLAYSWADQGINLDKSLEMLTRAVQAKPNDGYIVDSLGWVFYRLHKFDVAIPHLERAVELLPYDATINDHLGDAYWQVGRKNEARFQWQRAANYSEDHEADLKETLQDKLANGIEKLKPAKGNMLSDAIQKENGV